MTDINECKIRESLYALIARTLLKEIDVDTLESIISDENLSSYFPNFMEWSMLKEKSRQDLIDEYLDVDFTDMTLLHLAPYESFFKREDQMINSGGENPVIEFYNEYDFRVELGKARAISPDHIAIEAEFMYLLVNAQRKALEEGDTDGANSIKEIQKKFLNEHLLSFAPQYLMALKLEALTPFYHDVAEFSLEFLLSDNEYLNN
jgi:TorA maturation chaperone TorD